MQTWNQAYLTTPQRPHFLRHFPYTMAGDEPIAIKLDKDAEEKISEELTEKLTNEYDMDDGADDLVSHAGMTLLPMS